MNEKTLFYFFKYFYSFFLLILVFRLSFFLLQSRNWFYSHPHKNLGKNVLLFKRISHCAYELIMYTTFVAFYSNMDFASIMGVEIFFGG